jgi:hypothetical protein
MASNDQPRSRFFAFETNGGNIIIEAYDDMPHAGPVSRRGAIEETGKSLQEAFVQLGQIIQPLKNHVKAQLEDAEQVVVEFGVKITAGAGVVIARSEIEGNFKIAITWKK